MKPMTTGRRNFLRQSSGALLAAPIAFNQPSAADEERPNILWITCEDLSPHLGCYGDSVSHTPNLDRFAQKSIRYAKAFATAPLCTPARSSLITGVFASSMGTQHLRGEVPLSKSIKCFTEYLREAGYYCSNNVKEDYNFPTPKTAWDESSETAHWRNRNSNQPFFSVFNFMTTHQSRTRYGKKERDEINATLTPEEQTHPEDVKIPPYYPDTPVVRDNLASFYTQITLMDKEFQAILDQLKEDKLDGNTIVFFYSDHGDGLPRGKRWLHDTGIQVPLMIHFPEKYRHWAPSAPGSVLDELVSFIDFSPTVMRLAGLTPPAYMQGKSFLADPNAAPNNAVFAIRDRVDEVLMCSRTIRTKDYHYIRNFLPRRPRMQRSFFSEITPIRKEIRRLSAEGKLQGHETWLMQDTIPPDELYDIRVDPYELTNLADDPNHQDILRSLKKQLFDWMIDTHDLGLIPEIEMLKKSNGKSPYDAMRQTNFASELLPLADKVGRGAEHIDAFITALQDKNPSKRYWGATGLATLGPQAHSATESLQIALNDESPCVRFAAAEALCNLGQEKLAVPVLAQGLESGDVHVQLNASQILMAIGDKAKPAVPQMKKAIAGLEGTVDHGWYTRENLMHMAGLYE